MPSTRIPNIGDVDYEVTRLPEGVKGKSVIGVLEAPILITEQLSPGTKLEYIVAHEVGHRLTLDMIVNAYKESPVIFDLAPVPTAGLIRYFISLGLQQSQLRPVHPGTASKLSQIFDDNFRGEYTPDDVAREFIAEVYANWATNTGNIPEAIARRFKLLTTSKNRLLQLKGQEAAFLDTPQEQKTALIVVGAVLLTIVLLRL